MPVFETFLHFECIPLYTSHILFSSVKNTIIFVATFCCDFLSRLFVATFCCDFLLRLFVATFCCDFLSRLFVGFVDLKFTFCCEF